MATLKYIDEEGNIIDVLATSAGGEGTSDHGDLTGLSDDDHTQYHNDTRGDARYYTKSQVDTALTGKSDSTHNHDSRYYTETEIDTARSGKANSSHTHTASQISDSTATGRSVITAANAAAARTAIGAGTSSLAIGTTGSTAKAGDYAPTYADIPAGTVLRVVYTSSWPSRPTARTDIYIDWIGGITEPPGMLAGDTWSPEQA